MSGTALRSTYFPAPSVLQARRRGVIEALGGDGALILAGWASSRNYPANPLPYRANSHFLYLTGRPLEGAALLLNHDGATVYMPVLPADDALWHGAPVDHSELSEQLGCPVRPASELPSLDRASTGTLPPMDIRGRTQLASLLGIPPDGTAESEVDLALQDAIITLRLRHDHAAQAQLRQAAGATQAAHLAGLRATQAGHPEYRVAAAMQHAIASLGMTTAYPPIVTTRGEVLHQHLHQNIMQAGDLLLADVGAETPGGMAGDVTRTWPVSGRFTPPQREIYEVVLRAQLRAIELCRPGTRYRDVHLAACASLTEDLVSLGILRGDPQELIADGVHALFFPHGIGHLLGLDVHDMEDLGDRAGYAPGLKRSPDFGLCYLRLDRELEPGMAVTIEPGFYQIPGLLQDESRRAQFGDRIDWNRLADFDGVRGIRIEDDILVTNDEPEILTRDIPKEVVSLESHLDA